MRHLLMTHAAPVWLSMLNLCIVHAIPKVEINVHHLVKRRMDDFNKKVETVLQKYEGSDRPGLERSLKEVTYFHRDASNEMAKVLQPLIDRQRQFLDDHVQKVEALTQAAAEAAASGEEGHKHVYDTAVNPALYGDWDCKEQQQSLRIDVDNVSIDGGSGAHKALNELAFTSLGSIFVVSGPNDLVERTMEGKEVLWHRRGAEKSWHDFYAAANPEL